MKKLLALLLSALMCFALVACGAGGDDEEETLPPGVTEEKVNADDVADLIENALNGGAFEGSDADLSAALAEIPDTFEELLSMLDADTQKNAYLTELETFVSSLEGEISRMAIEMNGEKFSLADMAGMDFVYAGVKDGAVLLTTEIPPEFSGLSETIETNIYLTFDPETHTAYAVTEASGIVADMQVFPYGDMLDAYLTPDSETMLQIGMMYDMYVSEIKHSLETGMESATDSTVTLPTIEKGDLTSHGNNKFTLNNSYFEKAIRAMLGENAETKEAIDEMLEMLGLDMKVDFELYNKETIKSVSLSVSADITAYFVPGGEDFNPEIGTNRVIVDLDFFFNYEGDMQFAMTMDAKDMMKIDAAIALDVTKKDGKIVKGTQDVALSLTSDKKILFGEPDEDDIILENNVATVVGKTALALEMTQSFDLTALEKENATVYSMSCEMSSDIEGQKTSSKQEMTVKTTEVGKYTFTEKIDSVNGGVEQHVNFELDFAVGTAEGFNVPQVILDAIAAQ